MPPDDQQEFCPHLYDDLRERLRAKDQERAIELTYRLICSGRPLGEIIAQTAPARARPDGDPLEIAPSAVPLPEPPILLSARAGLAAAQDGDPAAPDGAAQAPAAPKCRASPVLDDVAPPPAAPRRPGGWRRARRVGFLLAYSVLLVLATILGLPALHRERPAWFAAAEPPAVAAPAVTVPIASAAAPVPRAFPSRRQPQAAAAASVGATRSAAAPSAAAPPDRRAAPPVADAHSAHPPVADAHLPVADSHSPVASPPEAARELADSPKLSPPATAAEPAAELLAEFSKPPAAAGSGRPATPPGPVGRSEIATELLVARGDARLGTGDLAAARLFYRRGAERGDGTAALRLGETFDPAFLRQAGLGVVAGDAATALYWYRRARALGNGDADLLLQNLKSARR